MSIKAKYTRKGSQSTQRCAIIRIEFIIDAEDIEVGVARAAYNVGDLSEVTSRDQVEFALKDQFRSLGDNHKQSTDFWDSFHASDCRGILNLDQDDQDIRQSQIAEKARSLFPEFYPATKDAK